MIASVLQVLGDQRQQRDRAADLRVRRRDRRGRATIRVRALVDRIQHLMLPTIVLILINAAFFSRIQRNLMLDALGSDFVRTARAKGSAAVAGP